jgi:CubicO group peptidase (beta-lactamase class C family)
VTTTGIAELPADLRAAIEDRLRDRGVHGLAIAAFDRDGLLFTGGVGLADVARAEPVTAATVFRVASVSKLVSTATVLTAVEAGVLDLDAPVNALLEPHRRVTDRTGTPTTATVRNLLQHDSGLVPSLRGATTGRNPVVNRISNGPGPIRDLRDSVTGLQVNREPGTGVVYANSGINLAGHLAATASGERFEDLAMRSVLGPLGMVDSAFGTGRHGPGIATPYGRISPPKVSGAPADRLQLIATPMGGLMTTVGDLARFGRAILRGGELDGERVLAPSTVAEALTLSARNHPGLGQGYGLGFRVQTWRGRRIVSHDGNMPGVASRVALAPDEGVGVVVLTNGFALGIPHEIANLAMADLLDARVTPPSGPRPEVAPTGLAGGYRQLRSAPPGWLATLDGWGTRIRVTPEDGGVLRVDGNPASDGPLRLVPDGAPGRYRMRARVDDDADAVVETSPEGVRIWAAFTTVLARRQPPFGRSAQGRDQGR